MYDLALVREILYRVCETYMPELIQTIRRILAELDA